MSETMDVRQMNTKRFLRLSVKVCLLMLVMALAFFFLRDYFWYDTWEFQGDGEISDHGFWYPRYYIMFDEIDLLNSGKHKMTFKGAPTTKFRLGLLIRGNYSDGPLKTFNTNIAVSIADDKGRMVCEVSAPLNDWKLARSIVERYLWRAECDDVSLSTRKTYTITILVESTESSDDSLPAHPFLRGGGTELP